MNKRFSLMLAAIVLLAITGTTVLGQDAEPRPPLASDAPAVSDRDLGLFRKDVRSLKKQIVAVIEDCARPRLQQDFFRDSDSEPFSVTGSLNQQESIGEVLYFRDDDLHSKYRIIRTLQ
jgi:hypothetical protein